MCEYVSIYRTLSFVCMCSFNSFLCVIVVVVVTVVVGGASAAVVLCVLSHYFIRVYECVYPLSS